MKGRNVPAAVQRIGMAASFGAEDAGFITRPAATAAAVPDRDEKIIAGSSECAGRARDGGKIGTMVCTSGRFMLWSGLMSAEPRSDPRDDQGEENSKGNSHKGSESVSIVVTPHAGQAPYQSQGSIARRGRSPQRAHFHLLPVSGRAGARASTDHVALTRVRRRRIASSGRPGESR